MRRRAYKLHVVETQTSTAKRLAQTSPDPAEACGRRVRCVPRTALTASSPIGTLLALSARKGLVLLAVGVATVAARERAVAAVHQASPQLSACGSPEGLRAPLGTSGPAAEALAASLSTTPAAGACTVLVLAAPVGTGRLCVLLLRRGLGIFLSRVRHR